MSARLLEGLLDETSITLGIIVLIGQLGFAGAYFLKFFIGKTLTLRLMLVCIAMVFVKMMEIRDRLF